MPRTLTLKFYTLCRSGNYHSYPIYLFKDVARRASKKWSDKCEWREKKSISFLKGWIQNCNDGRNSKIQLKCPLNRSEQTNSLMYWSVPVQSGGTRIFEMKQYLRI